MTNWLINLNMDVPKFSADEVKIILWLFIFNIMRILIRMYQWTSNMILPTAITPLVVIIANVDRTDQHPKLEIVKFRTLNTNVLAKRTYEDKGT